MAIWIPLVIAALIIEGCSDSEDDDSVGADAGNDDDASVNQNDGATQPKPPEPARPVSEYREVQVEGGYTSLSDGGYAVRQSDIVQIKPSGPVSTVAELPDAANPLTARSYLGTVPQHFAESPNGFISWYTSSTGFNGRGDQHGIVFSDRAGNYRDVNLHDQGLRGPGAAVVHGGRVYVSFTNGAEPRADFNVCYPETSALLVGDLSATDPLQTQFQYTLYNLPEVYNAASMLIDCPTQDQCSLLIAGAGDLYCGIADGEPVASKVVSLPLAALPQTLSSSTVSYPKSWSESAGVGVAGVSAQSDHDRIVFVGSNGMVGDGGAPRLHLMQKGIMQEIPLSPAVEDVGFLARGVFQGPDLLINGSTTLYGTQSLRLRFNAAGTALASAELLDFAAQFPNSFVSLCHGYYASGSGNLVTVWQTQ